MSDTPRTDKEESTQTQRYGCRMVKSDFARELEKENARLREAALAVITPLIMDTDVHPCDEMDMDKKAKACPYQVYALYRLCIPSA